MRKASLTATTIDAPVGLLDPLAATVELVTPAAAEAYLETNVENNRNLRQHWVQQYAADMRAGNWRATGDPIRFDATGKLIDGQHRLAALIVAEVTLPFHIVRGIDNDAMSVIDTGHARRPTDALKVAGYVNTSLLAASTKILSRIKAAPIDGRHVRPPTHSQLLQLLERHPLLPLSVSNTMRHSVPRGVRPSLLTVVHYLGTNVLDKADRAEAFMRVFHTGIHDYPGDPAHQLREKIIRDRDLPLRPTDTHVLLQMVHVWNLFAKRTPSKVLKFPKSVEFDNLDENKL